MGWDLLFQRVTRSQEETFCLIWLDWCFTTRIYHLYSGGQHCGWRKTGPTTMRRLLADRPTYGRRHHVKPMKSYVCLVTVIFQMLIVLLRLQRGKKHAEHLCHKKQDTLRSNWRKYETNWLTVNNTRISPDSRTPTPQRPVNMNTFNIRSHSQRITLVITETQVASFCLWT